MPPLSLLIKPASSKCNLNCTYCFYYNVSENRFIKDYGKMNDKILETLVKKSFDYMEYFGHFAFQGGEPTLVGIDFFEKFHSYVEYYNTKKINITYSLQTNGTLINKQWASLFKRYNYLIGVSLDGTEEVHNSFRKDWTQNGSFRDVMSGISYLKQEQIDFNILTVVTKETSTYIEDIYRFFQENNFKYLQFIPCIDNFNQEINHKYHLNAKSYEFFLKKLFVHYKKDLFNKNYTSIRYFDNLIGMLLGRNPESCDMIGKCSVNPTIESDGSVYPCDFYVLDQYKLGNILNDNFYDIFHNRVGHHFVSDSLLISKQCKSCKYIYLCRGGGCKRYHNPKININKFCQSYINFFETHYLDLIEIAQFIKNNNL